MSALSTSPAFAQAPAQASSSATTPDGPIYGAELQGFDYPYPISRFEFNSQRQRLQMAYMDVAPKVGTANGRTAVLLHGKNYCAATWGPTIAALSQAGYRVIAVDQIGFCKSSKPDNYQFTFQQLARNTNDLLHSLNIQQATIIGHSTGGMLAIRYALTYPKQTEQLVAVDPIGLEDWKAKGVPPISVDQWYDRELHTSADKIRSYEQSTYFAGQWRPDYEPWVQMLAGMYRGPQRNLVAWDSALLYDMILTQPVYYELSQLKVPTLLMIGDKDTTAIGKEFAPPAIRPTLGNYPVLAHQAAAVIPAVDLVEFPSAGHAPQMQDPGAFHVALLRGLANPAVAKTEAAGNTPPTASAQNPPQTEVKSHTQIQAANQAISQADPALVKTFAPGGTLRVSINLGNPVLATIDPSTGKAVGVSVDLATEFAKRLGVPMQMVVVKSAGNSVENVNNDKADIGFFAIDPKRGEQITFTKPYVLIEGYYLVRNDSAIKTNQQVDQPGVKVAVGKGSAYDLFLTRELHRATIVRIPTSPAVVQAFLDQHLDVAAGVKQQLEKDASTAGSVRILNQRFMVIRQAMGVPKAKGDKAAAYLASFVEDMKTSGFVAASIKRHGIQEAVVAGAND
jgi:pimeloyl-ACP methyl ester carboxylesterase